MGIPFGFSGKSPAYWTKNTILGFLVLAIIFCLYQAISLYVYFQQIDADAVVIGEAQSQKILESVSNHLKLVEHRAQQLAEQIRNGQIEPDELLERIKKDSLRTPYILGITVAFAPGKYRSDTRLYAPYYDVPSDKIIQCEDYYDYSDPKNQEDANWYLQPVQQGKPMWVSGFGPAAGATYAGRSIPIYTGEKKTLLAVVNVALSLHKLSSLINTEHVGRLGTSLMIDGDGVIIAHANAQILKSNKTWLELLKAKNLGNEEIYKIPGIMTQGNSGKYRFHQFRGFDPPQNGWFYYQPIPGTDWSFGVAIFDSELYTDETALRRRKIHLALTGFLVFMLIFAALVRFDRFDQNRLIKLVMVMTLGGIVVIGYIWQLEVTQGFHDHSTAETQQHIDDLTGLKTFMAQRTKIAEEEHLARPRFLPTRIYVHAIEFEDTHNIKLSGRVWQSYQKGQDDDLNQGFTFIDTAPDAEAVAIDEVFREERGDTVTVGWTFRVTLRETLSFARFPFDEQQLRIRIKHVDVTKNVILVPDLLNYRFINATTLPGLNHSLTLPGWNPRGTYFSYQTVRYDVAFGGPGSDLGHFPELQYNIALQRAFLTPFISYIVPILIMMFLLYGVVIMSSMKQEKQTESGFNVFGVLGTSGAFFFTIALMHVDLRNKISVDVITYLEALYIIAYILLFIVSLNSLLFLATDLVPWIEYRDNIVAKLCFWPVLIGLVLGVTLYTFY